MNQNEMIYKYNKDQLESNPQHKLLVYREKVFNLTNKKLDIKHRLSSDPNQKDINKLFTQEELDIIDIVKAFDRNSNILRIEIGNSNKLIFCGDRHYKYKIITTNINNLSKAMQYLKKEYTNNKELEDYDLLFNDNKTCNEIRKIFKFEDIEKGLISFAKKDGYIFSEDFIKTLANPSEKEVICVYNTIKQRFEEPSMEILNKIDISSLEFFMSIK